MCVKGITIAVSRHGECPDTRPICAVSTAIFRIPHPEFWVSIDPVADYGNGIWPYIEDESITKIRRLRANAPEKCTDERFVYFECPEYEKRMLWKTPVSLAMTYFATNGYDRIELCGMSWDDEAFCKSCFYAQHVIKSYPQVEFITGES